jgi:hypothetical protein
LTTIETTGNIFSSSKNYTILSSASKFSSAGGLDKGRPCEVMVYLERTLTDTTVVEEMRTLKKELVKP